MMMTIDNVLRKAAAVDRSEIKADQPTAVLPGEQVAGGWHVAP